MKQLIGFVAGILIPGLILMAGGIPNPALAQAWPSKPIRIVIAQAPSSPEQFAAHIRSEIARFTQIAKAAGIKAE